MSETTTTESHDLNPSASTMFRIHAQIGTARIGNLLVNAAARKLATPNYTLATLRGAPAYLTPDMVDSIPSLTAFSLASGDLLPMLKPVKAYADFLASTQQHTDDTSLSAATTPKPLEDTSKIAASPYHTMLQLQNQALALTLRNPFVEQEPAVTGNDLSVVGDRGNIKMPVSLYAELATVFRPDIVVLPSEDTPVGASSSKIDKVIRRNLSWSVPLLSSLASLPQSQQPFVFAPVEGGNSTTKRREHVERLQSQPRIPDGYVVGGFHLPEGTPALREQAMRDTIAATPATAARAVFASGGDPREVVEAVRLGADLMLNVTYPILATELGFALNFPITLDELRSAATTVTAAVVVEEKVPTATTSLGLVVADPQGDDAMTASSGEPEQKSALELAKKRNAAAKLAMTKEMAEAPDQLHLYMNLRRQVFREDPKPLMPDCACYACTHHTRAYINHLLNANEMLADTLLLVHNLHHYGRLFEQMRQLLASSSSDEWDEWCKLVSQVIPVHKPKMVNRRARMQGQSGDE